MYRTTRPRATRAATAWRWRCAPGCRCATWRWCSSIRRACSPARDTRMTGTVLEEGLRGAGGYLLERRARALHARTTIRAASARRATSSRARCSPRCAPAARRPTAALYICDGATSAPTTCAQAVQGHGRALRRLRLRSRRRPGRGGADRALHDGRRRVRRRLHDRAARASSPPARTRAACTAPTGSAATASRTRRCSAASPATAMAALGARRTASGASPTGRRSQRAIARCRGAAFAAPPGDLERSARRCYDCMWDDVGIVRDAARPARARSARSTSSTRGSTRTGVDGGDLALQPDLARLAQPEEPDRGVAASSHRGAGARRFARRAFPRGFSGDRRSRDLDVHRRATAGRIEVAHERVRFTRVQPGESLLAAHCDFYRAPRKSCPR